MMNNYFETLQFLIILLKFHCAYCEVIILPKKKKNKTEIKNSITFFFAVKLLVS